MSGHQVWWNNKKGTCSLIVNFNVNSMHLFHVIVVRSQKVMMTKSNRLSRSNYGNTMNTADDITVLENSSVVPSRECVG